MQPAQDKQLCKKKEDEEQRVKKGEGVQGRTGGKKKTLAVTDKHGKKWLGE